MHSAAQHALDHCAKSDKTATSASVNETESLSLAFEMDYFTMYMHKSSGQVPMHGDHLGRFPCMGIIWAGSHAWIIWAGSHAWGSSGQVPRHGSTGRFPCMDHLCERQMKVVIV